jgi:hypothetical protein
MLPPFKKTIESAFADDAKTAVAIAASTIAVVRHVLEILRTCFPPCVVVRDDRLQGGEQLSPPGELALRAASCENPAADGRGTSIHGDAKTQRLGGGHRRTIPHPPVLGIVEATTIIRVTTGVSVRRR